jgi:hypothetical protein
MLCLKQCLDMCDLSPEEVNALAKRASLPEIVAAQAVCPRQGGSDTVETPEEDVRCALLEQVRAAEDFAELRRVARNYRAFARARTPDRS